MLCVTLQPYVTLARTSRTYTVKIRSAAVQRTSPVLPCQSVRRWYVRSAHGYAVCSYLWFVHTLGLVRSLPVRRHGMRGDGC